MNGWIVLFWLAALGPFALFIRGVRQKLFGSGKMLGGAR